MHSGNTLSERNVHGAMTNEPDLAIEVSHYLPITEAKARSSGSSPLSVASKQGRLPNGERFRANLLESLLEFLRPNCLKLQALLLKVSERADRMKRTGTK